MRLDASIRAAMRSGGRTGGAWTCGAPAPRLPPRRLGGPRSRVSPEDW